MLSEIQTIYGENHKNKVQMNDCLLKQNAFQQILSVKRA